MRYATGLRQRVKWLEDRLGIAMNMIKNVALAGERFDNRLGAMGKRIDRLECPHERVKFVVDYDLDAHGRALFPRYWSECADCGKTLESYGTEAEFLRAEADDARRECERDRAICEAKVPAAEEAVRMAVGARERGMEDEVPRSAINQLCEDPLYRHLQPMVTEHGNWHPLITGMSQQKVAERAAGLALVGWVKVGRAQMLPDGRMVQVMECTRAQYEVARRAVAS